jgi:hypothetical protein
VLKSRRIPPISYDNMVGNALSLIGGIVKGTLAMQVATKNLSLRSPFVVASICKSRLVMQTWELLVAVVQDLW